MLAQPRQAITTMRIWSRTWPTPPMQKAVQTPKEQQKRQQPQKDRQHRLAKKMLAANPKARRSPETFGTTSATTAKTGEAMTTSTTKTPKNGSMKMMIWKRTWPISSTLAWAMKATVMLL